MIKRSDEEMYQFQREIAKDVLGIIEEMINHPRTPTEVRDIAMRRLDIQKQKVANFMGIPNPPYKAWVDGA